MGRQKKRFKIPKQKNKMTDNSIATYTVGIKEDDSNHGGDAEKKDNIVQEQPTDDTAADIETGKETDSSTPPLKTKPFIVLVACCAALGGLIFGYDIAGKDLQDE
jgi:hypothetical protein